MIIISIYFSQLETTLKYVITLLLNETIATHNFSLYKEHERERVWLLII